MKTGKLKDIKKLSTFQRIIRTFQCKSLKYRIKKYLKGFYC